MNSQEEETMYKKRLVKLENLISRSQDNETFMVRTEESDWTLIRGRDMLSPLEITKTHFLNELKRLKEN